MYSLSFLKKEIIWFLDAAFRIVGGDITDIGEVPYQASLYDGKHVCGGTIISKGAVLTAAHCLDPKNPEKDLIVTVGSNSYKKNDATSYKPIKVHIHDKYSPNPLANDIAVVLVDNDFIFSKTVKAAFLPKQNDFLKVGTVGRVSGWGSTHHASNKATDKLKSTYIKVTGEEECEKILVKSFGVKPVKGTHFCAAEDDFQSNICSVRPQKKIMVYIHILKNLWETW